MALERTALTHRGETLPDDRRRYQILDGALDVTPTPSPDHQEVLTRLNDAVRRHVEADGLGRTFFGPIDVILADATLPPFEQLALVPESRWPPTSVL